MSKPRRGLPLGALLAAYRAQVPAGQTSTSRTDAIRQARTTWLTESFIDQGSPASLSSQLLNFYRAVVPVPWHESTFTRRVGMIRHGLSHLLRGQDSTAARFARCAVSDGPYHVTGIGPTFWAAVTKALNPDQFPLWSPDLVRGLARVSLVRPESCRDLAQSWSAAAHAYDAVLSDHPDLTAFDLDTFFHAIASMTGRELELAPSPRNLQPDEIAEAIREIRTRTPLKKRSAEYTSTQNTARTEFEAALAERDAGRAFRVLAITPRASIDRLSQAADLLRHVRTPDDFPRALTDHPTMADLGISTVAAILHLRSPSRFPAWNEATLIGLSEVDDAFHSGLDPFEQYFLLCEVAAGLKHRFHVHPCEVSPLLESLGHSPASVPTIEPSLSGQFSGFCSDTFRFLTELAGHNQTGWMAAERDRYRFVVREPMVELCEALAARYILPVLGGEYGWDLETEPRPGRALTSITRTDFGRGGPYAPELGVTFARRRPGTRRDDAQFFVRLESRGVSVGFRLGRLARDAGRRFRKNVQEHGELLFAALRATGALDSCTWAEQVGPDRGKRIRTAADLRAWATSKELTAFCWYSPDSELLRSDDLVGAVLILFDRLVPLFAAAVEDDPRRIFSRRTGTPDGGRAFDRGAFRSATHLGDVWLTRALDLLKLKKQLILQGVPGTGKTHVARSLARFLTGDRSDCIRMVQFHPGYSYEEFVEGIRPKTIDSNGRNEVSYPVEPGLLATFADRAAKHPSDPHVLVIDEINRGNLPRVFGELLFLLEYRDQEVALPYSKVPFRLPGNLYLIATMNQADRSAVSLDQAIRRRFSFIDMAPDPAILAHWLDEHPPTDPDPTFAPRLVRWFEDLNRKLARDLGPDRLIGHSFFMVPDLKVETLRTVWDHHVLPVLTDLYPGRPDRVKAFDPTRAFETKPKRTARTTTMRG